MLFTIFCCISTGLAVFCICNRVQRRSIEIAVRLAVREAEKEYEHRMGEMLAQMTAKDGELSKARQLVKLHEAVPTRPVAPPARTAPQVAATAPAKKLKQDPLNVFEMSRPFTDTSYDALLASSDVVKVEPAGS